MTISFLVHNVLPDWSRYSCVHTEGSPSKLLHNWFTHSQHSPFGIVWFHGLKTCQFCVFQCWSCHLPGCCLQPGSFGVICAAFFPWWGFCQSFFLATWWTCKHARWSTSGCSSCSSRKRNSLMCDWRWWPWNQPGLAFREETWVWSPVNMRNAVSCCLLIKEAIILCTTSKAAAAAAAASIFYLSSRDRMSQSAALLPGPGFSFWDH